MRLAQPPQVRRASIKELVDSGAILVSDGYRTRKDQLGSSGYAIIRVAEIAGGTLDTDHVEEYVKAEYKDRIGSKVVEAGDVILSTKGTFGRRAIAPTNTPPAVYSPQVCFFRVLDERRLDRRFLYDWLGSRDFLDQAAGRNSQTDMAAYLSLRDLREIEVPLPPISFQRQAGRIPATLDSKITINREVNQTLESIARAVFRSWFVDFDPVRAKAAGRPTGLPPELDALLPDALVESEIGPVPDGWGVAPLNDHVTVTRGLSYSGASLCKEGEGVPMHNLNSVYEGGGYKHAGIKWYKGEYKERHVARPGDLLVANTEQGFERLLIAHAALVPAAWDIDTIFSHHLYKVTPRKKSRLSRAFTCYWLNNPPTHARVSGFANGTTVNMLPPDALSMPAILVPPAELVTQFTRVAATVHARMQLNHEQTGTLTELRDLLLPRLVSGELIFPTEVAP